MNHSPPNLRPAGSLFVIAAPSGAGKSSLVQALLQQDTHIQLSVSYTTRAPRTGEINGIAYHFCTTERFHEMKTQGDFIESAHVHGNYYGTSKTWIDQALSSGKDILLEIDWQGAQQVRQHYPHMIGIFILPPSFEELKNRLIQRGTDSDAVIAQRLANANEEINHAPEFEYVIINTVFDTALKELAQVVCAARLRYCAQYARQATTFKALGLSSGTPSVL